VHPDGPTGVLHVTQGHGGGGGTGRHVRTLVAAAGERYRHYIATAAGDDWRIEEPLSDGAMRVFEFRRQSEESWPAFVGAIASNSLHHFPDPLVAMAEIARVLKPGGVLVSYDPRYVTPLEKLKKLLRRNDSAFTKDHKAFRVDEYRELLGSSGLQVTEVRTVDPVGPLLATGLDYLKVGKLGVAPKVAKILVATDRLLSGAGGNTPFGLMLAGRAVKQV